ncbi:MAG: hypothetical protein HQK54_07655, partial [Oligoflexales bacterium]|nr:hypothetical protein [Oligoflexales bacterium]
MKISRRFTKKHGHPYDGIKFEKRNSLLVKSDGSLSSVRKEITVPDFWNQVSSDILAQKYLKSHVTSEGEGENDARQVFHRLAGCWRSWGLKADYFDSEEDADAF